MINLTQALLEPSSAIICFVLVWFTLKPYRLTGENSFLGLPLGFGIMGISHIIATAVAFTSDLSWLMLLFRTFSFVFIAITYLFSGKTSRTQFLWNLTLSAIVVALITLSLLVYVAPQPVWQSYSTAQIYCRIFMSACLLYVIFYTLRSHLQKPDPNTLWFPIGFVLLALSQYSLIIYYVDHNIVPFWGGIVFRFAGLLVFLAVAYRTFYVKRETK